MKLTKILAAATLAIVMPLAASAATIEIDDGGTYLLGDYAVGDFFRYDEDLPNADSGDGVLMFNFENTVGLTVELFATTTVLVNGDGAGSNPDATGGFDGSDSDLADGSFNAFSTFLAASDTATFYVRTGAITPLYNLDIAVRYDLAAVPIPAAGFLLIGALGGLAALRRRKA